VHTTVLILPPAANTVGHSSRVTDKLLQTRVKPQPTLAAAASASVKQSRKYDYDTGKLACTAVSNHFLRFADVHMPLYSTLNCDSILLRERLAISNCSYIAL
jgi:predicted nucleic acid-binding protein